MVSVQYVVIDRPSLQICGLLLLCDRATACPMVKVKDEWGEASDCDKGDRCTYCHSRMELQFHPDVSLLILPFICLAMSSVAM